ncbi:hypothetical protein EV176_002791 [Coemansia sp. RSA 451]|nr:hypothetical protein EV176_002791 [Coemansia sp. RSA 451]
MDSSTLSSPRTWPKRRPPIPHINSTAPPSWDTATLVPHSPKHWDKHQRTIDDLTRQLDDCTHELAEHTQLVCALQQKVQVHARQERVLANINEQMSQELDRVCVQHKQDLREIGQEHTRRMNSADRTAKQAADKAEACILEMRTRIIALENRVVELVLEQRKLVAKVEHARVRSASVGARLQNAERAVVRSHLGIVRRDESIREYKALVMELERRVVELSEVPCADFGGVSLFAELAKAAGEAGEIDDAEEIEGVDVEMECVDVEIECAVETKNKWGLGDAAYWAAVALHMAWSMYVDLIVRPLLHLSLAIIAASLNAIVPTFLLRTNLIMLMSKLKPVT